MIKRIAISIFLVLCLAGIGWSADGDRVVEGTRADSIDTVTLDTTSDVTVGGDVSAATFTGDGSNLENVEADQSAAITFSAKVNEAGGITKGQVVYFSGATGQFPQVSIADNTIYEKSNLIGVAGETKTDGQTILIRMTGELSAFDTSGWADGDVLYMSTTGAMTSTVPLTGKTIIIGGVQYSHAINGIVAIKIVCLDTGGIYSIGQAGQAGFGVATHPGDLPSGFSALTGADNSRSANYGNYQYSDGSIMVWIPKFYYKVHDGTCLPVNWVEIRGPDVFSTTAAANTAGYALHRAFIDGGAEQDGFFVDKYKCSKTALGTGFVASSIKNGLPISTHADHNPIADLTACSSNYNHQTINAAHARDGVDGAVNSSSIFFVKSQFIQAALAMISMAQAQATTAATPDNAWFSTAYPYPKGCNDDTLADTDDSDVTYTTDGYSNCGKTGSGIPFSKTTHNGQACGVADLNGLMWEVSLGITCIATDDTIEDITRANPAVVTETGHTKTTGQFIVLTGIAGGDWAALDDKLYQVTKIGADTYSLDDINTSGYALAYVVGTNGGTTANGTFYITKQSTSMKDFTSGDSGATDHWGATGCAAMMDSFTPVFKSGGAFAQRFGSGTNQVLSAATSGNSWVLTGLGLPMAGDAVDSTGTTQFGKDYFYQHVQNELYLLSCGHWSAGSAAGVWRVSLSNSRADSSSNNGFRAACYPVD